jgi:hypothetical protein
VSDVLEDGSQRPPLPRWVRGTAAAVLVVAAGAYGVAEAGGGEPSPGPSPSPSVSAPTAAGASTAAPWRVRTGACGTQVRLPRSTARARPLRTGLRVLVGGAQLVHADVDTGTVTPVRGVPHPAASQVRRLAAVGDDVYVTLTPACEPPYRPAALLRLAGGTLPRRVDLRGPIDDVIAGAGRVWGVDHPAALSQQVVLRSPDGATVRLPAGIRPAGVTRSGVIGTTRTPTAATGSPGTILHVDPASGEASPLGLGRRLLAVGADFVLWREYGCDQPHHACLLRRSGVPGGQDRGSFLLPAGRVLLSQAVLDAGGRFAAFALARPEEDHVRVGEHAGGPWTEIVVLDLDTGRLQAVPQLMLPPEGGAGLAFSADARWLVVSVTHGDHGHLYAWRRGGDQVLRSPVRLPGPLVSAPPVLVLARGRSAP